MKIPTYDIEVSLHGSGYWVREDEMLLVHVGPNREEAEDVLAEYRRHAQAKYDIYLKHAPPMLRAAIEAKEAAK